MLMRKKQATSLDVALIIQEINKIYPDFSEEKTLEQEFIPLIKNMSLLAFNLFLQGLEQETDKKNYLISWKNFLEKKISDEKLLDIEMLFLSQYPWNFLNHSSFFILIEKLSKPEMKNLWSWFVKFFNPKLAVAIDQKTLEENINLFLKFVELCEQHNVMDYISLPPRNNFSFYFQGRDYIENCIHVLSNSSQIITQAQLLHTLPERDLIDQAFAMHLPFVCQSMVNQQAISLLDLQQLMLINEYRDYKAKALTYFSTQANHEKNKFIDCVNFFNELDFIKLKKLNDDEKLLLAKVFTRYAPNGINSAKANAFIYWANKIKEMFGESYFIKLLEFPIHDDTTIHHYINACRLLADLADDVDTESIFEQAENIPTLIQLLEDEQQACLQKKYPEKDIEEVLSNFQNQSEFVQFPLSENEIQQLKQDYLAIKQLAPDLVMMDVTQLAAEAARCGSALKNSDDQESKIKLIAILRELIRKEFKLYPYNTQIVSLLSLISVPKEMKGRIAQIHTGEGKSLIIAMLAAYQACQEKTVDVITSSRYLAIRDQKKYQPFYNSLNLSSSHICYDQPKKKDFDGQILYLTNYDGEFSLLRDVFFQKDLRYTTKDGQLVKRKFEVAIVDEADNLFVDAALNSARLAIPAAYHTAWIYEPILKFIKKCGKNFQNSEENILKLRLLLTNFQAGKFKQQVETFTDKQLLIWMQSAYQAQFEKKLGRDYIIKSCPRMTANGEEDVLQIIIIDHQNTGRMQKGSRWSEGVHEFVEVKHGLKPKDQSATFAAISHPAFFNYYESIFGLTGTIGEVEERSEIKEVYKIDSFDVPSHFPNQRVKQNPDCYLTRDTHHQAMLENIQAAVKKGQPVLVLFGSILDSIEFSDFLKRKKITHQLLNETQQQHEDYIIDKAGSSGTVTVATNIAGRGTDIILTPESKTAGGLHVLMGHYPASLRFGKQGDGRSGRQGQPGSCKMILYCEDEEIKKLIENQNERFALCKDKNFMTKLNLLRSEKIMQQSQQRIQQSQFEIICYEVLNQFGEIFQHFNKELNSIQLNEISSACHALQTAVTSSTISTTLTSSTISTTTTATSSISSASSVPVEFMSDVSLEPLHKQAQDLLSKQAQGQSVDWETAFLPYTKQCYFLHVQQKWAAFFSQLDKRNFSGDKINRVDYQTKVQKQFAMFMNTNMRKEMLNPQAGFSRFLSKIIHPDLKRKINIESNDSQFFSEWYEKIRPKFLETKVANNGLFSTPKVEEPNPNITSSFSNRLFK